MRIVVTGGAGYIGSKLVAQLIDRHHEVTVIDRRAAVRLAGARYIVCNLVTGALPAAVFRRAEAIVHVAGVPVFGGPWTTRYKQAVYDSRVTSARRIAKLISSFGLGQRPRVIVSASATAIYGDRPDEILTETSATDDTYVARLCRDWEMAWQLCRSSSTRLVYLRSGLVVSEDGGIVQRLKPLLRRGIYLLPGVGKQWISWISASDLVRVYIETLERDAYDGVINAVAPRPVRQREFVAALKLFHHTQGRSLVIPAWLIRLLLRDASLPLLASQRVKPTQLLAHAFIFRDRTILQALESS